MAWVYAFFQGRPSESVQGKKKEKNTAQDLKLSRPPHFTAISMIPEQDISYASSRQESQRRPLFNNVLETTIRACGPEGRNVRWAVSGSNFRLA
ncbi:hypothetical protein PpBr36_01763 [Pyricularia pennisetigena]|uniref:hypothetical protein n=1 Tax=Pyricularia pennisetigena TaxID=1578925 RepID=UPI001154842C|nr:hypothetical protein PpBr36_01763 [Pyricularia pennisetigena]TLS27855.1 hypothetical protein PpBr36_01763 [Pyricularia pennisetigena]